MPRASCDNSKCKCNLFSLFYSVVCEYLLVSQTVLLTLPRRCSEKRFFIIQILISFTRSRAFCRRNPPLHGAWGYKAVSYMYSRSRICLQFHYFESFQVKRSEEFEKNSIRISNAVFSYLKICKFRHKGQCSFHIVLQNVYFCIFKVYEKVNYLSCLIEFVLVVRLQVC